MSVFKSQIYVFESHSFATNFATTILHTYNGMLKIFKPIIWLNFAILKPLNQSSFCESSNLSKARSQEAHSGAESSNWPVHFCRDEKFSAFHSYQFQEVKADYISYELGSIKGSFTPVAGRCGCYSGLQCCRDRKFPISLKKCNNLSQVHSLV